MNNPTIEIDIAEILKEIRTDQKTLLEKVNSIDSRLIKVETKLDSELPAIQEKTKGIKELGDRLTKIESGQGKIEEKLNSQGKIVEELKTSQKNQIWALIVLAFTAVIGLTGAFGKIVFFP